MMMAPIALAHRAPGRPGGHAVRRFSTALLLGIAYSASVGGTATLIGTPPNLSMVVITGGSSPVRHRCLRPLVLRPPRPFSCSPRYGPPPRHVPARFRQPRIDMVVILEQYRALGPVTFEQRAVFAIFAAMALLWLTREGIRPKPSPGGRALQRLPRRHRAPPALISSYSPRPRGRRAPHGLADGPRALGHRAPLRRRLRLAVASQPPGSPPGRRTDDRLAGFRRSPSSSSSASPSPSSGLVQ